MLSNHGASSLKQNTSTDKSQQGLFPQELDMYIHIKLTRKQRNTWGRFLENPFQKVSSDWDCCPGNGTLNNLFVGRIIRCESQSGPCNCSCHCTIFLHKKNKIKFLSVCKILAVPRLVLKTCIGTVTVDIIPTSRQQPHTCWTEVNVTLVI